MWELHVAYTLSSIFQTFTIRANMNHSFILFYVMMVIWMFSGKCKAAPGFIGIHRALKNYPHIYGYAIEGLMNDFAEDLVGEDEDNLQLSKRQQLDDYGHMRFGKRSRGDNVGYRHLRFGRNVK